MLGFYDMFLVYVKVVVGLMLEQCIIRRSRNNQHYALVLYYTFILYTGSNIFR
jgi:hypothetical protein